MKQSLLLLTLIFVMAQQSNAQYITIPDQNLRNVLLQRFPSCFNASQQMDTTCSEIINETQFSVMWTAISDWQGFQYLRNLQDLQFANTYTLPVLPSTLKTLNVNVFIGGFLPPLPNGLLSLRCTETDLNSLPALPSSLVSLDLNGDAFVIQVLPTLPSSLLMLKVRSNSNVLNSLPALPNSIKHIELECPGGGFTSLPALPAALEHLTINRNGSLTSLPVLPASLDTLILTYNSISSLPVLPASLKILDCNHNQLSLIPSLPAQLEYADLNYNNISSLPALPASLRTLIVYNNQLSVLPSIPAGLLKLDYSYNQVSDYPVLPSTLRFLGCSVNQVSSIPTLPDSLRDFNCYGNQLTSIPGLPVFLERLNCSSNQISYLPSFPSYLENIECQNNNIVCMPVLPNIIPGMDFIGLAMNFDDEITCIPNIPPLGMELRIWHDGIANTGNVNTYPLCSAVNNVNHCDAFPLMTGHVYYDNNNNLVHDANEPYKSGARIDLSNGYFTFSDNNGYYQVAAPDTGNYTTTVISPIYFTSAPLQHNFHFTGFDTLVVNDFGFQATATRDSLGIHIYPLNAARPGFPYPCQIAYENDGTTTLNPNIVFNYDNTRLIYDSCSNAAVVNTGSSLTLSETAFVPGQQKSFIGYFRVNPTAVIGDSLRSGAHVMGGSAAAHDSVVVAIRGSYDPNDKSATPALSPAQVINGDYIYYTIRFQNTGTDTAFSIVITDTLHNKLRPSTLQMTATSHPCITTVKNNTISFEFINIMLPDSNVNQLKSHGYISFRIKPLNTLVVNDIVPNKAAIYFDYNSPVITNMATTTVVDPIVVPLKLLSFTVSRGVGQHANLYWQTNNEVNVKSYIVEMSTNGRTYNAVGVENAKGYQYNNYTKTIAIPSDAVLYFRLKMTDVDGRYTYSNVAILKNDKANNAFSFLNNPAKDELSISLQDESLRNTTATIFNAQGIKIRTVLLQHDVENINIKSLPGGTYYLVTEKGGGQFVILR